MSCPETTEMPVAPAGGGRRRWLLPLGMTVLFVSGAAVGGGVMTVVVEDHTRDVLAHPEKMVGRILPALQQKLGLSEQQSDQVNEIIRRHHARLETIRAEVRPRFKAEWKLMDDEIASVLDATQKDRFREWSESMRKRCLPEARASRSSRWHAKSELNSEQQTEEKSEEKSE